LDNKQAELNSSVLNQDEVKSDDDDFQLAMARQVLKSWNALRGK